MEDMELVGTLRDCLERSRRLSADLDGNSEDIAHCVGEDVQSVYRNLTDEMARQVREVGGRLSSILQSGS